MAEVILSGLIKHVCLRWHLNGFFHKHRHFAHRATSFLTTTHRHGIAKNSNIVITSKCAKSTETKDNDGTSRLPSYADTDSPASVEGLLHKDMIVVDDFVSEAEENDILGEIEPYMARLRYEYSHWDDAIHGYRETERSSWNPTNASVINRLKEAAFPNVSAPTDYVHILDLEETGEIKPHKDSIRFCGDTIAGMSLLSDCVMRLVNIENKDLIVDILLKQRSLYIMRKIIYEKEEESP